MNDLGQMPITSPDANIIAGLPVAKTGSGFSKYIWIILLIVLVVGGIAAFYFTDGGKSFLPQDSDSTSDSDDDDDDVRHQSAAAISAEQIKEAKAVKAAKKKAAKAAKTKAEKDKAAKSAKTAKDSKPSTVAKPADHSKHPDTHPATKPANHTGAEHTGAEHTGAQHFEGFVGDKGYRDLCDKPRFVNSAIVGDYKLSAKVISDRGNSCLKNCVTDKDHDFVNNSAKLPGGHPASFIDSSLEYSNFSAVCKEPAQNYCGSNAQVISKYSPGGLLMVEQNDNNLTTNSGLSLTSAVINSNKKPAPIPQPSKQVIEHFAGAGAAIELVLIVFMASWCPHCKDAKPHLNQFKKKFHNGELDGVDVKVIEYDADVHKDEIKKHGVSGYPTYKLLAKYKDGSEKVHEHEGGRLFDDLVALCKKHL